MATDGKKKFWTYLDEMEGDKIVWIVVLLLILCSILCLFSSTSSLLKGEATRIDILKGQIILSLAGIGVLIFCYNIKSLRVWKFFAKWGFLLSLGLLVFVAGHLNLGVVRAASVNGSWRILSVAGQQIHVLEVVKVSMMMYLAWAMDAYRNGHFDKWFTDPKYAHWADDLRRWTALYIPFVLIFVLALTASGSAAFITGGLMLLLIMLGGGKFKDLLVLMAGGLLLLGVVAGLNHVSRSASNPNGAVFERWATIENRLIGAVKDSPAEEIAKTAPVGSRDFQDAIDEIRQPYSAKIAIHQGKIIGKGPGRSSQRYVVPDFSEDYMFSFIIEEYGIIGGIFVIMIYLSLLARGTIIARNCDDFFAKMCVAGLVLLISGQAFLHIFVNVDIGPMTGQTLPVISHGTSAFLCFMAAFGVILSLSRIAAKRMKKEQQDAVPLVELEQVKEEAQAEQESTLSDLADFESEKTNDEPEYEEV
ncbi:MAG: FtsW/RodA/SpoVE family cell cycle protein [Bacteroidales bacterium]|nr:FtsW/RodA/SpoVE family cell cycle protein [Bacteroidales bacterium]